MRISAIEPSIVAYLTANQLETLTASNPLVFARIEKLINESLACLQLHVIEPTLKTPQEKLASMLLRIALRFGVPCGDSAKFSMPMSRTDAADYLGIETETVSRTISKLRSNGYLSTNGRHEFIINNLKQFSELSPLADLFLERTRKGILKSYKADDSMM